jgi:hypothetical protein
LHVKRPLQTKNWGFNSLDFSIDSKISLKPNQEELKKEINFSWNEAPIASDGDFHDNRELSGVEVHDVLVNQIGLTPDFAREVIK